MKITHPHKLSSAEAHQRITSLLGTLQKKYAAFIGKATSAWNPENTCMDFTLLISNDITTGTINLDSGKVVLECEIPAKAKLFTIAIEMAIKKEMAAILG